MSDPYIGEIRMFAGNYAPDGWMLCQGQLVSIADYDTLFNLIGTTYGGDGVNTFALPNLASRMPVHMGSGGGATYTLGQAGGLEQVTLTAAQLPVHTHTVYASSQNGYTADPTNAVWAASPYTAYSGATPDAPMAATAIDSAGGGQPHDNMSPYLAINFIISMYGIYPSAN